MRKLFLLSVLFIFMGNVSANSDSTAIKVIEVAGGVGSKHPRIMVYCIAGRVFAQNDSGTLIQVMDSRVGGEIFSMTCKDYKKKMK